MLSPVVTATITFLGIITGLVICYYALVIVVGYSDWAKGIKQGRKNGKTGFGFFLKYALVRINEAIWILILVCLFLWVFHVALALVMKVLRSSNT
jgi:hypothetical protein